MSKSDQHEKPLDQSAGVAQEKGKSPSSREKSGHAEDFPVIGIGSSAGGLEALQAFFSNISVKSGMAYIVVSHLSKDHPNLMPELLQKRTKCPVSTAEDGQAVEPDHVYVAPPGKEIGLFRGTIQVFEPSKRQFSLPIDFFFKSLAQDRNEKAAVAVMSGAGTDGSLGLKAIKENDGLVMAQSEESAVYDGMPRAARETGLVDMVLAPADMPEKIVRYFENKGIAKGKKPSADLERTEWLNKIFVVLRTRTGHDFSFYKSNTIIRRIDRRMVLNQIKDYETYIRFLRENPEEIDTLFRELLIGVTGFFRDPEAFETLKKVVLPEELKKAPQGSTFRVWTPGCSTGEEAYSLAMVIHECLDEASKRINIQLFGTDIDTRAIEKARDGVFPANVAVDVGAERLKRFFVKEGESYRMRKNIRDCVVFSEQNVLRDPPFSHLNLLCCRNLMIYLNTEAQRKLMPLFHYTLNPGGVLVLGPSESIGGFANLFKTVSSTWKIYRRLEVPESLRRQVVFPSGKALDARKKTAEPAAIDARGIDIGRVFEKLVSEQYSPTSVLVDKDGSIVHVLGRTGKYLEQASGPFTRRILDMARPGLRIELAAAMRKAVSSGNPASRKNIRVKTNGDTQTVHCHVNPVKRPKELEGHLMVVFEDVAAPPSAADPEQASDAEPSGLQDARLEELENELRYTRENHQSTIEELESTNEELQSANEELQSANEELQSTNEELVSSKEELQSLNEELQTVNAELQSKVDELSSAQDDFRNLLNNTSIATIFVDNRLRIKRYTDEATKIINLIGTDIGRPFRHVVTNLAYDKINDDLELAIKTLIPKESEVATTDGEWYNMRIAPYRTIDNRIDGAVMTFTGIGDQKKAQSALQVVNAEMDLLLRNVFNMDLNPMALLDQTGKVVTANAAFYQWMEIPEERDAFVFEQGHLKTAGFKEKLEAAFEKNESSVSADFDVEGREGTERFFIRGRIIRQMPGIPYRVILKIDWEKKERRNHGI